MVFQSTIMVPAAPKTVDSQLYCAETSHRNRHFARVEAIESGVVKPPVLDSPLTLTNPCAAKMYVFNALQ
jgi:hypothetical protein